MLGASDEESLGEVGRGNPSVRSAHGRCFPGGPEGVGSGAQGPEDLWNTRRGQAEIRLQAPGQVLRLSVQASVPSPAMVKVVTETGYTFQGQVV